MNSFVERTCSVENLCLLGPCVVFVSDRTADALWMERRYTEIDRHQTKETYYREKKTPIAHGWSEGIQ